MILETIVTTVAEDGTVNCAPMGVEWGDAAIILKPFLETATYRNLLATRAAVVNVIDDVRVFAGLLATGVDRAIDFNCRSAQEKGLCPAASCDHDLRIDQHRLLEVTDI